MCPEASVLAVSAAALQVFLLWISPSGRGVPHLELVGFGGQQLYVALFQIHGEEKANSLSGSWYFLSSQCSRFLIVSCASPGNSLTCFC